MQNSKLVISLPSTFELGKNKAGVCFAPPNFPLGFKEGFSIKEGSQCLTRRVSDSKATQCHFRCFRRHSNSRCFSLNSNRSSNFNHNSCSSNSSRFCLLTIKLMPLIVPSGRIFILIHRRFFCRSSRLFCPLF